MDFPANTISQREWFKSIFSEVEPPHQLMYIDIPNEICRDQIEKRRTEQPERKTTDTTEMFAHVAKYFAEPADEEGFNLVIMVTKHRNAINPDRKKRLFSLFFVSGHRRC